MVMAPASRSAQRGPDRRPAWSSHHWRARRWCCQSGS